MTWIQNESIVLFNNYLELIYKTINHGQGRIWTYFGREGTGLKRKFYFSFNFSGNFIDSRIFGVGTDRPAPTISTPMVMALPYMSSGTAHSK